MQRIVIAAFLSCVCACTGLLGGKDSASGGESARGFSPQGPASARLLTRFEYANAVVALKLTKDPSPVAVLLPEESIQHGFDNQAPIHKATARHIDSYQRAAETITADASFDPTAFALTQGGCAASTLDTACVQRFVENFLKRAFRRPSTPAEQSRYMALFNLARTEKDANEGISRVVQGVLQSPSFLYRLERRPLDGYAIASRLSFFLWGTGPDDALLNAAEQGLLSSVSAITEQAKRMVADPRTALMARHFFSQWLEVDRLNGITKVDSVDNLGLDWRESLLRFTDASLKSEKGFEALWTSPSLYLNGSLRTLYGVPQGQNADWAIYQAPSTERAGLLSQPALMGLFSHADQSSPILRGVFVRSRVLCESLPPPPANMQFAPPKLEGNMSTRQRFAKLTEPATCAGCHSYINPVGFGFERYDHLGRLRATETVMGQVQPIDDRGELISFNGGPSVSAFSGVTGGEGLSSKLAMLEATRSCFSLQWFRYGMGRSETVNDTETLGRMTSELTTTQDIKALLVSLATSEAFRANPSKIEENP